VNSNLTLSKRTLVVFWVGGVSVGLVPIGLCLGTDFALADSILVAVLLVLMPALAIAQAPLLAEAKLERLPAYWSSIATLSFLGTLSWLVGTRDGGAGAIGVRALPVMSMAIWTTLLTAAGLFTVVWFRQVGLRMGLSDTRSIRDLLPKTGAERRVFFLLSIAAGVGEELSYRGYLIPVLMPIVGSWGAVAVTSAVFGLLHLYQGGIGLVRTATMGGLLAWGFLASGSLVPGILAHTLIDILAGLLLADRLLLPLSESGVAE
jgi:membrane protease YdiL (CAAX protease family)